MTTALRVVIALVLLAIAAASLWVLLASGEAARESRSAYRVLSGLVGTACVLGSFWLLRPRRSG